MSVILKIFGFWEFIQTRIHPQILLRLATYPIGALCSYFNFWAISHFFGSSSLNLFMLAWMLIGSVQILEYALGVQIMNTVALYGFHRKVLKQLLINISILGITILALGKLLMNSSRDGFIAHYLLQFDSRSFINSSTLVWIFCIPLFFSGSFQLISRIFLGLKRNSMVQILNLSGYAISTLAIIFYLCTHQKFDFWIVMFLGLSPMAVAFFPSLLILLRLELENPPKTSLKGRDLIGVQYSLVYFFVSALSTFSNYFPRLMTNLVGKDLTLYLLSFTLVGMFMNISSSVSQVFWVDNVRAFPGREIVKRRYRLSLLGSLSVLPIFLSMSALTYIVYTDTAFNLKLIYLISLSVIALILQNIHLITSSLIISKSDLLSCCFILLIQNIIFLILSKIIGVGIGSEMYLSIFILVSVFFNYIPSAFLVYRKIL